MFKQKKLKQLSKIDKSSIGGIDPRIKSLCNKINKKRNYYTTSSCAGRIVLLKGEINKEPNKFLFRTHNKTTFKEIKTELENLEYENVFFKQSPCILHVACKDLESAQDLVNLAKLAGWKHSGIMATKKRIMIELHSTEHLELPIIENKKILVNDEFLKILVKHANQRLERVWKKIKKLTLSIN